jgi:hypothetical protein
VTSAIDRTLAAARTRISLVEPTEASWLLSSGASLNG